MFGIIIFFVLLGLILWFLRSYALKYYEKIEAENTAFTQPITKQKEETEDEYDKILPVILAAASAMMNTKIKVKKISFVNPAKGAEWSQTGRIQNLTSHYMSSPKTYKY